MAGILQRNLGAAGRPNWNWRRSQHTFLLQWADLLRSDQFAHGQQCCYYILAHQYIAAELNFLQGADPTAAQDAFNAAKALFEQYTPDEVARASSDSLRMEFVRSCHGPWMITTWARSVRDISRTRRRKRADRRISRSH